MDAPISDYGFNNKMKKLVPIETFKEKLVSNSNPYGYTVEILNVNRDDKSGIINQARQASFNIYANAVEKKHGGDANMRYAWYADTKDELKTILNDGFVFPLGVSNGVSLSPSYLTPPNLQPTDENGYKHMLLCRVILGRAEVVLPGSNQYEPSSDEFDSGVDNLESPDKYIIWNRNMTTHILPEFIMMARVSSASSLRRVLSRVSESGGIHLSNVIKDFIKTLPADGFARVIKYQRRYIEGIIGCSELVQQLRRIAGNKTFNKVVIGYLGKIIRHEVQTEQRDEFVSELFSQFFNPAKHQIKIKR